MRRFHLSERLAVRIAALQSKQVDLTAAVLESAAPGSATEKLLLHPRVLSEAQSLTTELLRTLVQELPAGDIPSLAVQLAEGWRTIGLEEELLATGLARRPEDTVEPSQLPLRVDPFQLVDRDELVELFTPSEITELKVALLTSADPKQKISALRKLLLAPASAKDKAALLITALGDASAEVRAEAAEGLSRLGLDRGISEAARTLALGAPDQREFAAGELGRLVHTVKEAEVAILLTVLAGAMDSEREEAIQRALVRAAAEAAPFAGRNPEHARELARLLVHQIRPAARQLWPTIRSAVAQLGVAAPQPVAALLREEVEKAPDGPVRRFLFTLFADFPLPQPMAEMLAHEISAEAARGGASEEELQTLSNQLAVVGEPAVAELCARFEKASAERRPALARMIDLVCARQGISADAKNRAAALFARALKTADRHLRSTLLETELPTRADLSDAVRAELAEELLASLEEFSHPRIVAEVEAKVSRMGPAALEPLRTALRSSRREADRVSAARSLAMLIGRLPKGSAPLEQQAQQALQEVLEVAGRSAGKTKAELIRAAGRIAGAESIPPSRAEALAAQLKVDLRSSDCPYAILEALAQIASHPHAPLQLQLDAATTFIGLLQEELPELVLQSQTADPEVFELGKQVLVYTEMIPILLRGLREIFLRTSSAALKERTLSVLLARWREASEWRLLWGPGNTVLLLEALGAIGSNSETSGTMRLAIMEALMGRVDFPPAVQALGNICREQPASRGLAGRAAELARRLEARLAQRASMAGGEADGIYEALGKIAGRQRLGETENDAPTIRQRLLNALFEGIREGYAGAATGLRQVTSTGVLSAEAQQDAQTRLEDFDRTRGRLPRSKKE